MRTRPPCPKERPRTCDRWPLWIPMLYACGHTMTQPDVRDDVLKQLRGELENFEEIAKFLLPQPGDIPKLDGIDLWGGTLALNGVVGGDHLIYVDYKQRFD